MCGRFVVFSEPGDLAKLFEVDQIRTEEIPPRYNIAPTQEVYSVAQTSDGERRLGTLRWGLVPHWAKEPRSGPINARAETVAEKPMFRTAFSRSRCIIPADGFYEWREDPTSGKKIPHFIHREDGHPLAFAGLWSAWRPKDDPDADPLNTCVIITTAAQDWVKEIHDRMPVSLPQDAWDRWLDPTVDDEEGLQELLEPRLPETLTYREVSTRVNNARNEGPELLEPDEDGNEDSGDERT